MKPIKIYGESKTGTTYLQKLLELNTDADIIPGNDWSRLGWKHGFPQHGDALYIFIFRNVYEWAKSLIADPIDKRFNGLEAKFGGANYDHWNMWENPIQCRTAKYYSYLGFGLTHETIIINYDWLRKDLESLFLELEYYGYDHRMIKDIQTHTYKAIEYRDNPDRKPLTKQQKSFIDSQIDPELESFVDNLTIE